MYKLIGKFTKFIFISEKGDFFVALFKIKDSFGEDFVDTITISGKTKVEINNNYLIEISKSKNLKYENTWVLERFEEVIPAKKRDIINFLSSYKFPKIGEKVAQKIYEHFGDNVINILNDQPEQIFDNNLNIPKAKKEIIFEVFEKTFINKKLETFFINNDFSLNLLNELQKNFRIDEIEEILENNPYKFLDEINFSYFNDVDKIGRIMNYDTFSNERLSYLFLNVLNNLCFNTGNTLIKVSQFFKELQFSLLLTKEKYAEVLFYMSEEKMAFIYFNKFVAPFKIYAQEIEIAARINEILKLKNKNKYEKNEIDYFDQIQNKALNMAIKEKISIITGGPGTGKTEILKQIINELLKTFKENDLAILAPTGRAAYRIFEKTGFDARTIHSFLGAKKHDSEFAYNKNNYVSQKVLVIDEFSMVNTNLFFHLLNAFQPEKLEKIILIGDPDQIPSIGPGNLLNNFIEYQKIATTKLEKNYRQKNNIGIIEDAQLVNKEKFPLFKTPESQFSLANERNFLKILDERLEYFLPNFNIEDITILSPIYDGYWGINKINDFIQQKLFKDQKVFNIKGRNFYIGDKVLQNENDINLNVFNGEIGFISDIKVFDNEIKFINITFPNSKVVQYTLKQFNEYITLGYCISIHKFQGSESSVVILNLLEAKFMLVSKKLLYTGITRAQKFLHVIGKKEAIEKAINNNYDNERLTYLSKILI